MTTEPRPFHVGFYYHVPVDLSGAVPKTQAIIGLYVTELARQAGRVTFYAHSGAPSPLDDFEIGDDRVRVVDLGPRRSAPALTYAPGPSLRAYDPQGDGVDVMLIRGPSAFLPQLAKAAGVPVALQLVGDMANETNQSFFAWWRNLAIWLWRRHYMWTQDRIARRALVLAKSAAIRPRRGGSFPDGVVVFTSTLPAATVSGREPVPTTWPAGTGSERPLRLLYTGRVVSVKGLFETVSAVAELVARGRDVSFHIVGWSDPKDPTVHDLDEHARSLGVADRLHHDGYRTAGDELLDAMAGYHVYVFPTYGEGGLARAVVEAMALGLPVVTTDIRAIDGLIEDGEHALLVRPRSASDIVGAVERLIEEPELRARIAAAGRDLARGFTIERSVELTIDELRRYVERRSPS